MNFKAPFQSVIWRDDHIRIIDQTQLPEQETLIRLSTPEEVWDAIKKLKVRGAPAIGIAAAYGFVLGVRQLSDDLTFDRFFTECERISDYLNSSRPTAVNLSWALKRINAEVYTQREKPVSDLKQLILDTAIAIHDEDRELCRLIGQHGAELVPQSSHILTHCNTGGLATGEFGTAFSMILHAHRAGSVEKVWVDETRPLLQGARLTAWELKKAEIPHSLLVDSAAAFLMKQGKIDLIVTGADRITRNGDTANKIGTYNLAVLAQHHNIPFYIAAPYSTIDLSLESGDDIEIELRGADEVCHFGERRTAPEGTDVWNPAFDVTPAGLITAIITEKGVVRPDYSKNLTALFETADPA